MGIEYRKFPREPDGEMNSIIAVEAAAWVLFASAFRGSSGEQSGMAHVAASYADSLIVQFRQRFMQEPAKYGDKNAGMDDRYS